MNKPSFDNTNVAFASKTDAELARMYWLFRCINSPLLVKIGQPLLKLALNLNLPVKNLIKRTIFKQFCGGETINESMAVVQELGHFQIGSILDYSVEGAENEASFMQTKEEIIHTIQAASKSDFIPFAVFKVSGLFNTDLLMKVQAKAALSRDEAESYAKGMERVNEICEAAHDLEVAIMIDAEESWIQNTIDDIARLMMERYNQQSPIVYNTVQLYRHDRLQWIADELKYAEAYSFFMGLKLVRGAYMEKERERAKRLGYPSPIQPDKASTDRDFNEAQNFCIKHADRISIVSGTHNEESCKLLLALIAETQTEVWFAQLLGMSDHLSFNLAASGYRVAKYLPYGPVKAVMPYLFRRAEENTAISGQMGRELSLIIAEKNRRKGRK